MTKRRKSFYAIAVGMDPAPCIVRTWEEALKLVEGVPGARHRGFFHLADAEVWLRRTLKKLDGGFYRGPLPDLVRPDWRERQIEEQFNIEKEYQHERTYL